MKLPILTLFSTTLFLVTAPLPTLSATPQLQSDSHVATAGYYSLSWSSDFEGDFILEEASDTAFQHTKVLYRGPDTATLISGRPNGVYYYRIRTAQDTPASNLWSNVATVEVAHHPLSRAFLFFALGAMVFLATLVIVIRGSKAHGH